MTVFTQQDLDDFALVSGDWNPIHTSPSDARRLITGEIVAHGIFVLLRALDDLCQLSDLTLATVKCRFLKPIFIETEVQINVSIISEQKAKILVTCNSLACLSIIITFGGTKNLNTLNLKLANT